MLLVQVLEIADSEGVEGMSASKMRKAALENDFDSFKKGVPKDTKPETLKISINKFANL